MTLIRTLTLTVFGMSFNEIIINWWSFFCFNGYFNQIRPFLDFLLSNNKNNNIKIMYSDLINRSLFFLDSYTLFVLK